MSKTYIGDGVYAEIDPFGTLTLTTEDGIRVTNTIHLVPEVMEVLYQILRKNIKGLQE